VEQYSSGVRTLLKKDRASFGVGPCSTWNKTAAILMAVNSHADLDALSTQIGVETRES
jgi:hypothetical protein